VAAFRVVNSFRLESRNLVIFAGEIEEGVIKSGMTIRLPRSSGTPEELRICGVEFVEMGGGKGLVGLTVVYDGDDNARRLLELDVRDRALEVDETTAEID